MRVVNAEKSGKISNEVDKHISKTSPQKNH